MSAGEQVVRVRWSRGAYTSEAMAADRADELAAAVADLVEACGDTWRLFEFAAWHGTVRIRGRDVVGVEVRPWVEPRSEQRLAHGGYVGAPMPPGSTPTGTAWLQQRAGLDELGAQR